MLRLNLLTPAPSHLLTPWHPTFNCEKRTFFRYFQEFFIKKPNHTLTLDKCTISDMLNVLSIVHCFILLLCLCALDLEIILALRLEILLRVAGPAELRTANISIPAAWALGRRAGSHGAGAGAVAWQAPSGGLYLRVRPPAHALAGATLEGETLLAVDRRRHLVWFERALLVREEPSRALEDIRLSFTRE